MPGTKPQARGMEMNILQTEPWEVCSSAGRRDEPTDSCSAAQRLNTAEEVATQFRNRRFLNIHTPRHFLKKQGNNS